MGESTWGINGPEEWSSRINGRGQAFFDRSKRGDGEAISRVCEGGGVYRACVSQEWRSHTALVEQSDSQGTEAKCSLPASDTTPVQGRIEKAEERGQTHTIRASEQCDSSGTEMKCGLPVSDTIPVQGRLESEAELSISTAESSCVSTSTFERTKFP